jgi:Sulfotransferase domain
VRQQDSVGPDIAVVGAARSGTSLLASQLGLHPNVDPCSIKEPNFFSRGEGKDVDWYDGLFAPRSEGLMRLDASASYTYPQHAQALSRLAEASDNVFVVYVVRDPLERAISHYLFYRYYFRNERASTFSEALRNSSYYIDVSDYQRWLQALKGHFKDQQVLVAPFDLVTQSTYGVAKEICQRIGLTDPPQQASRVDAHRNSVVTFRSTTARNITRKLRQSSIYPQVRKSLGADRMKQLRAMVTKVPALPTKDEVLASCDSSQLAQLQDLRARADHAVSDWLKGQDARTGLSWSGYWSTTSFAQRKDLDL